MFWNRSDIIIIIIGLRQIDRSQNSLRRERKRV